MTLRLVSFHEFIRRISQIYVHLKNYNLLLLFLFHFIPREEKNVFCSKQADEGRKKLYREHIFKLLMLNFFALKFPSLQQNFFQSSRAIY